MLSEKPDMPPDEVLHLSEQLAGGGLRWAQLFGGRTNQIWRGKRGDVDLVFKLFDKSRANPLFPNDPKAEEKALDALKGTDLAPVFRAQADLSCGLCLVYDHLPGALLTRADQPTITTLAQLHHMPAPAGMRRIETTPAALLEQGHRFLALSDTALARKISRYTPKYTDVPPGPNVFLHGDPVPANVIADGVRRRFIDWQCPAYGDATADLAIALSPAMHCVYGGDALSAAEIWDVLSAYPDPDVVERFRGLAPFYRWRMAAYCAWKAAAGERVYEAAAEAELSSEIA